MTWQPQASADSQTLHVFQDILFRVIVFGVSFLPVDAGAREGGVVVLREGELVKGGIHLSDAVKIGALVGSRIPEKRVSCIRISNGLLKWATSLFPDIPASADAYCGQALFQSGSPDIAVQMHTEDQSAFVNKIIGAG